MNKDILGIIEQAARMGAAEAVRRIDPASDLISQRTAFKEFGKAFVTANADSLTTLRKGAASNSPRYYSRAELVQLLAARSIAIMSCRLEHL